MVRFIWLARHPLISGRHSRKRQPDRPIADATPRRAATGLRSAIIAAPMAPSQPEGPAAFDTIGSGASSRPMIDRAAADCHINRSDDGRPRDRHDDIHPLHKSLSSLRADRVLRQRFATSNSSTQAFIRFGFSLGCIEIKVACIRVSRSEDVYADFAPYEASARTSTPVSARGRLRRRCASRAPMPRFGAHAPDDTSLNARRQPG